MKITVFTSNQPRHTSLIESLASVSDGVYAMQEVTTLFPGKVEDFYRKSEVMQTYFTKVQEAERTVFGSPRPLPENVRSFPMKMGDLTSLPIESLDQALQSDIFIVFGASFIRQPLIGKLMERKAVNIHMGISPQYRGSSCNFWALYDGRANLVGATIHRLTDGLDSGPMLFHAFPKTEPTDAFLLGMLAVRAAHKGLVEHIKKGDLLSLPTVDQDKKGELRYTKNADFTDAVAQEYLGQMPSAADVEKQLKKRDLSSFLHPFIEGGR